MTLVLILLGMLVLLMSGMPIFAGLGLMATGLLYTVEGQISSLAEIAFGKLDVYLLVCIPLFALMAHVIIKAKVVDDLYAAVHGLVRHWPGGLGVATVLSCAVFAAISGSSVATALTIGTSAIPQMQRFGYPSRSAYGVVAAGGTLGILIPPSGPMVLYGVVSDTSIGALFMGGILPGLLVAILFCSFCMVRSIRNQEQKQLERASWAEISALMRRAIWPLLLPPLILGGMYFGVFTATEAAGVGAIAAIFISAVIYRNLTWKDLYEAAKETVRTTSMLFMILIGAAMFSHVLTIMRLPAMLVESVTALGIGPVTFILVIMAVIVVLGMFLETIAIILITTPILLPVIDALGIDPVWYGIMLMINLELALITPPVGMNLFVIKGISDAPIAEVLRGALPYTLLMLIGLFLVLIWPELALWLPRSMNYGL
jgi:C4-dicarboxylate transporter DctM subunit